MRLMALVVMTSSVAGCEVAFPLEDPCATDGHDEDCDGIIDDLDNCPSVSNRDQLDELEVQPDGVGDVCDPRPLDSGDAIVRFDGFAGPAAAVAARWTFGTSWDFDGESLVFGGGSGTVTDLTNSQPARPFALEFGVTFDETYTYQEAPKIISGLHVIVDRTETASGVQCGVTHQPFNGTLTSSSLVSYGDAAVSSGNAQFLSRSIVAGDRVRIVAIYDGETIACRVFQDAGAPPTSMLTLDPVPSLPGGFLFAGQNVKQRVDYMTIYKLP